MALFKVVIGVSVVQDDRNVVRPVRDNQQTQVQVEIDAVDANAAYDHVAARLQELLSAPIGT